MQVLKRGHTELFRRGPDECYATLADLTAYCQEQKAKSVDRWLPPRSLRPRPLALDRLVIDFAGAGTDGADGTYQMNDWSFTQLCQLAKVNRDTVNRVTADTAWRVFQDTLPDGNKPLQLYTDGQNIRSIHGVSYTRLYNADILAMLAEFATDFQPPQKAAFGGKNDSGGTGLYAGEQDMFCFLIDPTGWAEIEGQTFAPGFFVWNSEVGKRSLGIQTFWFQAICQNHIVWDAVEVVEFTRKHTASIHESLAEMRRIVEQLVAKRDERRDGFAKVMLKAMHERLGNDAEEVAKVLMQHGIGRNWAKQALEIAQEQGRFTIFAMVDALTTITQRRNRFPTDLVRNVHHPVPGDHGTSECVGFPGAVPFLEGAAMSYALSFAPEFIWGKVPVEKMKPSDSPTSVYQAILSLTDEQWASLARELFGIEPNNLDVEMVIQRIVETNTCRNLDPPVEIWIDQDGFFSVLVH